MTCLCNIWNVLAVCCLWLTNSKHYLSEADIQSHIMACNYSHKISVWSIEARLLHKEKKWLIQHLNFISDKFQSVIFVFIYANKNTARSIVPWLLRFMRSLAIASQIIFLSKLRNSHTLKSLVIYLKKYDKIPAIIIRENVEMF